MKLNFISHTLKYKLQPISATNIVENVYSIIPNKIAFKELKDEYQTALNMARALEYNTEFKKFILWFRKNNGLFEIKPLNEDSLKNLTQLAPADLVKQFNKSVYARITLSTIRLKYIINEELLKQIPFIYSYNAIFLPLIQPDIKIITDSEMDKLTIKNNRVYGENSYDFLNIQIASKITKESILDFIRKNKTVINDKLTLLKRDTFQIAEEKNIKKYLKIFQFKTQGKTFTKIADILNKESNNTNDNEESVKQAYYRTKNIITSLFKPIK